MTNNKRLRIIFLALVILLASSVDARKRHGNRRTETDKIENREDSGSSLDLLDEGPETSCDAECPQRRQSPINFDFQMIVAKFSPLVWSREYNRIPDSIIAENDGETVKVTVKFNDGQVPMLSGGPLLHRYKFAQLHFHWGTQNNVGSEHTLFNTSFPLEVHAVHVREDLTVEEAANYFDGFAVVGYFASIGFNGSPMFKAIGDQSQSLKKVKSSTKLNGQFPLSSILPQFDGKYFTYSGSLTTEPYTEAVSWIVSNERVSITQRQLNQLRDIASGNPRMVNNFRETQPLNGRVVTFATCL